MLCTEFLCAVGEKNRSHFNNLILERTLLLWWPFINNRDSARVFFLFCYKLALVDRFHRIFSQSSTCALFLLPWHFRKICTTAFAERRVRGVVCWQILTICTLSTQVNQTVTHARGGKQVHQGDTVAKRTFHRSTWQTKSCGNLEAVKCCPHKYWSSGLSP